MYVKNVEITNKRNMLKIIKGDDIKIVEEVNRRKLELIIYASYFMGFMACHERRTPDNSFNYEEIHNLIEIISKPITDIKQGNNNN